MKPGNLYKVVSTRLLCSRVDDNVWLRRDDFLFVLSKKSMCIIVLCKHGVVQVAKALVRDGETRRLTRIR